MDDEMKRRLDDLWTKEAIASATLQRIVDEQASLAEKQLSGITKSGARGGSVGRL